MPKSVRRGQPDKVLALAIAAAFLVIIAGLILLAVL
jgi:preprotein translocase subunit Sec61beta